MTEPTGGPGGPPPPVLVDPRGRLRLRPWEAGDAGALAAAWSTPDIAGRARGPGGTDPADAARWIGGAAARAAAGLAVDLVIAPPAGAGVWGEVGVVRRRFTPDDGSAPARTAWEVGWWVRPAHRGRGLAAVAVGLLASWAGPALGIDGWIARIAPGNEASRRVAEAVGLTRRGRADADHDLWVGPCRGPAPPDGPGTRV